MKKLAKLINGILVLNPSEINTSYGTVRNPSEAQLVNEGFKELVDNRQDTSVTQELAFDKYIETENSIIATYLVVDLTPEEIRKKYEEEVSMRIRERYTLDEELSILRKRDSNTSEFAEYNDYCESVKNEIKPKYYVV